MTALRAPRSPRWPPMTGPLQMCLFDEQNLAEITHPDYPGERLIACRNPALAAERARKRLELLDATETALAPITAAVTAGRLTGADKIGLRVGKVIGRYKMAKHFTRHHRHHLDVSPATPARSTPKPLWTASTCSAPPSPADELDAAAVVGPYKNLAYVERDFRSLKAIDLDLRPSTTAPRPRQSPRVHLHARRLPDLAPRATPGRR